MPPHKYGLVAKEAVSFGVDVVTTSGMATGCAASIDKVEMMRRALGKHPLALASGVTPENVDSYLPYVDAFLVASGIEQEFGSFNPRRVAELVRRIREYQPETT